MPNITHISKGEYVEPETVRIETKRGVRHEGNKGVKSQASRESRSANDCGARQSEDYGGSDTAEEGARHASATSKEDLVAFTQSTMVCGGCGSTGSVVPVFNDTGQETHTECKACNWKSNGAQEVRFTLSE